MNLLTNYADIVCDGTLMKSTIIALSETWLEKTQELCIDGFTACFNSVGPGKGLAIYTRDNSFKETRNVNSKNMQITVLESNELKIIIVYRSEQGNITELYQHIKDDILEEKSTVIAGDLNICYKTQRSNKITQFLENNGFIQLVTEATHTMGRQIDHMYLKIGSTIQKNHSIYRYSPYYTDHDALCLTLKKK